MVEVAWERLLIRTDRPDTAEMLGCKIPPGTIVDAITVNGKLP